MSTNFPQKPATVSYPSGKDTSITTILSISLSSFVIYTCMYGFRKAYTVSTYDHIFFLGISYKVCLVIAQTIGYMISKFYGIKFISAVQPAKRIFYILMFIGIAWGALFLFAIIPRPYNILCMFVNGLPLGMVFGLVFGFIEGRKTTELIGAFLVTSFVFGSGLAKSIGKWLILQFFISEAWMPFLAGALYFIPLLIALRILYKTPEPTAEDREFRSVRNPMTPRDRKHLIRGFGASLIPVIITYTLITILRDFSEDFAGELWIETGFKNNASIFTQTSSLISLILLAVIGSFFLIKNNFLAFKGVYILMMVGALTPIFSTLLMMFHLINPLLWMIISMMGIYLAYLPFNGFYFERMIAAFKIKGNVGFLMYIADAFGYLGTILVLLIKEFMPVKYSWVHFFSFLYVAIGIIGFLLAGIGFIIHIRMYKSRLLIVDK